VALVSLRARSPYLNLFAALYAGLRHAVAVALGSGMLYGAIDAQGFWVMAAL